MFFKVARVMTYVLTVLGLSLIAVGVGLWWRQSELEAELLAQDERVLLAVTAEPVHTLAPATPATLPKSVLASPASELAPIPAATEVPGEPVPASSATPVSEGALAVENSAEPPAVQVTPAAEPSKPPQPTPTPDPFPPASSVPSRIVVPAIGLDAEVVEMGWELKTRSDGTSYSEWVVPQHAAGWHMNSALPGHESNTVLSGHHNIHGEVFRDIVQLEPGDEVQLEVDGTLYSYQVQEKYIVKEKGEPIEVRRENNKFIEPTPEERLTLVSCWPYETNTHRVVVIARPLFASVASVDQGAGTATGN